MQPRLAVAVGAGKLAAILSRRLGRGGGTTVPGHVVRFVDPGAVTAISSRISRGSIVVTGTNGKTTTTRMISAILSGAGLRVMHNRSGANLMTGITTTLVRNASLTGRPRADVGLFEVDEATFTSAVHGLRPRLVVVTNLFRDQLDRYGEVDYVASIWRQSLADLPESSTVLLNADDPRVASLGEGTAAKVLYYGIDDTSLDTGAVAHAADSRFCVKCGTPYSYSAVFYSHVGHYRCPSCGHSRPEPQLRVTEAEMSGIEGSRLRLVGPKGAMELHLRVPGLYNVYNGLAATAAGLALGLEPHVVSAGISGFSAAFGRVERIQMQGRELFLALVKNPVGFNEVLSTILRQPGDRKVVIVINDQFADGTDISWLWDVDFEMLAGRVSFAVVSGLRAEDMAVRLKYAGVDPSIVLTEADTDKALRMALERTSEGETLYVLPTYTAMLDLRASLAAAGHVSQFWED